MSSRLPTGSRAASNPGAAPAGPARPPTASPDARAAGLHLDGQLCFALYATSLAMTKVYRPLLAPLGLTYPQYVVMLALWQHGELSAGALGERVSLDSGTLVALVRKLVAMGLVERRRSASDDRSVLISLTLVGAELRERAHPVHDQVACATQSTAAERHVLVRSLHALRGALTRGAPLAVAASTSIPAPRAERPIPKRPRAPMRQP